MIKMTTAMPPHAPGPWAARSDIALGEPLGRVESKLRRSIGWGGVHCAARDVVKWALRAGAELKRAKASDMHAFLRGERADGSKHSLYRGRGCALSGAWAHVALHPGDELLLIHLF